MGQVKALAVGSVKCCNMIVSSAALMRYDQRAQGVEAQNQIEKWVDTHFDDARMKQIYPKAKSTR